MSLYAIADVHLSLEPTSRWTCSARPGNDMSPVWRPVAGGGFRRRYRVAGG
jgi:hypothetical protein